MKAARIIVIIAVLAGGGFYYYNFSKKKAAIDANNLAKKQIEDGDFAGAIERLDKVYKEAEKHADIKESIDQLYVLAYAGHGKELLTGKKYSESIAAYNKISKYSSEASRKERVNFNVGYCYANMKVTRKNTQKAVKYLGKALKENPKDNEVKLWVKRCDARMKGIPLNKKAVAAFKKGDYKAAKSAFLKLSKSFSLITASKSTPWYYLAQIAVQEKNGEEALKYLKESVKEQGGQPGMKQKHDTLSAVLKKNFPDLFKEKNEAFNKLID
ncbi:MAG: tetratricopeptide repeat protein [Planctomycetota bacterium]|jgi:tetratricopeptide (TPR) repeat protein